MDVTVGCIFLLCVGRFRVCRVDERALALTLGWELFPGRCFCCWLSWGSGNVGETTVQLSYFLTRDLYLCFDVCVLLCVLQWPFLIVTLGTVLLRVNSSLVTFYAVLLLCVMLWVTPCLLFIGSSLYEGASLVVLSCLLCRGSSLYEVATFVSVLLCSVFSVLRGKFSVTLLWLFCSGLFLWRVPG